MINGSQTIQMMESTTELTMDHYLNYGVNMVISSKEKNLNQLTKTKQAIKFSKLSSMLIY